MHMKARHGFTLVELLVVIAIAALLAALLFPGIQRSTARVQDLSCLSQLKQIGVASIIFAGEWGDFPAATMPNTNRFLSPLQPLLPIIANARIFICPTETERKPSPDMGSLNRSNTSYFVSYSARMDEPNSIMAGDRNLTWDNSLVTGANQFQRIYSFGWWRDMHRSKGNLLLGDGSVHLTTTPQFAATISSQPTATFTWYIPNGDVVITPQ
jgi:prepilin-type N-terminal cleavage/methylation domain-containing protein